MTTAPGDGIPVETETTEAPKPTVLVDEDGDLHCSVCGTTEVIRKTSATDHERVGWDFAAQVMEAYKSYDFQVQTEVFVCEEEDCPATELEWDDPAHPTYETGACRFCGHDVFRSIVEGTWIAPDAGFDTEGGDGIWRDTCPDNDAFVAPHEPA